MEVEPPVLSGVINCSNFISLFPGLHFHCTSHRKNGSRTPCEICIYTMIAAMGNCHLVILGAFRIKISWNHGSGGLWFFFFLVVVVWMLLLFGLLCFVCFSILLLLFYLDCISFFVWKHMTLICLTDVLRSPKKTKFKSRLNPVLGILSINCCQLAVPLPSVLNLFWLLLFIYT